MRPRRGIVGWRPFHDPPHWPPRPPPPTPNPALRAHRGFLFSTSSRYFSRSNLGSSGSDITAQTSSLAAVALPHALSQHFHETYHRSSSSGSSSPGTSPSPHLSASVCDRTRAGHGRRGRGRRWRIGGRSRRRRRRRGRTSGGPGRGICINTCTFFGRNCCEGEDVHSRPWRPLCGMSRGGGGARRWRRRSVWNRVMQCLARVNGERVSAAAVVGGREGRRRCCRVAQWLGAQTSFPLPSRSSWQGKWPIQPTVADQGRGASTTTIDLSATTRCTGDHNVFDTEPAGRDRGETRQTRRTEATARTATEGLQQQPAEHRGCSRSRGHDAGHTPSTD